MMRAIKQSSLPIPINWTLALKTKSAAPNWCLHRFRLFGDAVGTIPTNAIVEARKADGTVISQQPFHDPNNAWGPGYEHTFMFDLSYNTTKEEVGIYIAKVPSTAHFQQLYAVYAHAGTAVRYQDDPAAAGMSNAALSYVNMGFLKFDQEANSGFVYIENQVITEIAGADQFYGRVIDVSGNGNISSASIDNLIIGIDANGVQPSTVSGSVCTLKIDAGKRTALSNTAWASLGTKGWTLTEI